MTETKEDHFPVRVEVVNQSEQVREFAPELASWQSYNLTGAETGSASFRILPQDTRRFKAKIYCIGTAGGIYLGTRAQVMNGQGFALNVCNDITLESQAEVWMSADGTNAVTVSILDERYVK